MVSFMANPLARGFMLQRLAALVEVEAAVSGLQSFQIAKMGETFAG
jgi:hypothetical protein